jgi:protein-tyrosine phosphatase
LIDIHCHILPGIDDGARDFDEAVLMCRLAAEDGCEAMIATPHQRTLHWWNDDREHLAQLAAELQRRVGSTLRVLLGGEVRVDRELLAEVELLPAGGIQPLAGSRYLLLELDRYGLGPDPEPIVHELVVADWWPILAHPEHYPWLMADLPRARRLVELGAVYQITAASLIGRSGRGPEQACRRLLDDGGVAFLASDAHGVSRRPPGLAEARRLLTQGWGEEVARALTRDNALAVIENRPLPHLVAA